MFNKKTVLVIIAGAFVLALAIGGVALASFTRAEAQTSFGPAMVAPVFGGAFGDAGDGGFAHRGGPRFPGTDMPGRGGDGGAYLAEALGITVDQLNDAQAAVREQAIDQALADGLITEAQAEALKEGKFGGRAAMLGGFLVGDDAIDHQALLAEELGISVSELEAAKEDAADLAIQAKIDSGQLTEEQAEMLQAHMALKDYIDKAEMFEDATGLTPEEFRQAMQKLLPGCGRAGSRRWRHHPGTSRPDPQR